MKIDTIKNELVIEARHLNKPTARKKLFLLEGEDIIQWALDAQLTLKHVFVSINYSNTSLLEQLTKQNIKIYECSDGIMKKINESKYLIPIIGVAIAPKKSDINKPNMILMLEDLQDQGNLGTIIRTSCAFGVNNIITTGRSIDLYNKKSITASRGAVFRINSESTNNELDYIKNLKQNGYQIIATSPRGNSLQSLLKLDKKPVVLVVGNEAKGVSDEILNASDMVIKIPMNDEIESLNVGVAAGISLYELKLKVLISMLTKNIRKTLGREIAVLHKLIQKALDVELKHACHYTSQQFVLLMIMACDESMTLKQIEKDIACYGKELDALLQPLLQEAFVIKKNENYSITPQGKELLAKLWDVEKNTESKILSGFTLDEQRQLKSFINRINKIC